MSRKKGYFYSRSLQEEFLNTILEGKPDLETVRTLIQRGADVNGRCDNYPNTALMYACGNACCKESKQLIPFLLEAGADVNMILNGRSALSILCSESKGDNRLNQIRLLVKYGANVKDQSYLVRLLNRGNWKSAQFLIDTVPNIRPTSLLFDCINSCTLSPMDSIILFLLRNGADVNTKDNDGQTVLMLAVQRSTSSGVEVLLQHGADVNAQNSEGKGALIFALNHCDIRIIELLLQNGADPNRIDQSSFFLI